MSSLEQQLGQIQGKLDALPTLKEEIVGIRYDLKDLYKRMDKTCTDCSPSVEVRILRKDHDDHLEEHRTERNLLWGFIASLILAVVGLVINAISKG